MSDTAKTEKQLLKEPTALRREVAELKNDQAQDDLGVQVILTGVRSNIARTLVHLDVELSEIETHFSLIGGLKIALDMGGLEVVRKTAGGQEGN